MPETVLSGEEQLYSISDAARLVGVHPSTLRLWETQGLISPQRTPGGDRRYRLGELKALLNRQMDGRRRENGAILPPVPPTSPIPVRSLEHYRPRPRLVWAKLFAVLAGVILAGSLWQASPPLTKERLKQAFEAGPVSPIVDVNDIFEYGVKDNVIQDLVAKFPLRAKSIAADFLRVATSALFETSRFLGTVFFGEGEDYFVSSTGDASFNSVTSNEGEVTNLSVVNLTVTGQSTGGGGGGGSAEGGDADTLEGQAGSYYLDLDNETGTCSNCLTTAEIDESTLTISLSDANTLDGLDSLQFLRSDTSDSLTSGTLTFNLGTTVDINGSLQLPATGISGAGTGSGLDADLLDGQTGSYYLDRTNHTGTQTASTISDFNESSQDSVGGILTDTTSVNFTYDDLGNLITADVLAGGVDHGSLSGLGDDDHPQYLLANGTRALTGNWDSGSFEIRAQTFQSDVTTGTAPLIVASTTLVANLNADLLDGQEGTYYLDLDNETGTCANCLSTTEIDESTFTGLGSTNISDIYLFNSGDTASGDYNFDANTFVIDSATDRVGIGKATPGAKLDVNGAIVVGSGPTGGLSGSIKAGNFNATTFDTVRSIGIWDNAAASYFVAGQSDSANIRLSWNYNVTPASATAQLRTNGHSNPIIIGNNWMYFKTDGNVGIGDITPDGKLDVESTGAVTSSTYGLNLSNLVTNADTDGINKYGAYITSTGGFGGLGGAATSNWGLYVDTVSGADFNYGAYIAGNVGIGTATPDSLLTVYSTTAETKATIESNNVDGDALLVFENTGVRAWTIGQDDGDADKFKISNVEGLTGAVMTIDTAGFVGIGTTTPFTILEVQKTGASADAPATSGTVDPSVVTRSHFGLIGLDTGVLNNGTAFIQNRLVGDFSSNYNFLINPNGGNVGIGTVGPGYKLDVNGDMNLVAGSVYRIGGVAQSGSSKWTAGTGDDIYRNLGNVGIGTTTPAAKLHLARDDASTNTQIEIARLGRTTSGTAATNIGTYQSYQIEASNGTLYEAGRMGFLLRDATAPGTPGGEFVVSTWRDSASQEGLWEALSVYVDGAKKWICGNSQRENGPDCFGFTIGSANQAFFAFDGSVKWQWDYSGTTFSNQALSGVDMKFTTLGSTNTIAFDQGNTGGTDMYIASGGNVGIGTTTTPYKLTVGGNVNINNADPYLILTENDQAVDGKIWDQYASGGVLSFRTVNDAYTVASNWMAVTRSGTTISQVVFPNGNVGIGTASPTAGMKLEVVGRSLFTNDGNVIANFNRLTSDGTLVEFDRGGATKGSISVSGETVSYNAFTGSHYAWTEETIGRGMLVSMTGENRNLHDGPGSEIVYGITISSRANDPKILGSYLDIQEPTKPPSKDNPHLVMATGNGDMWVVDMGANLEIGDYLISSGIPGHGMKDDGTYSPAHVVARLAEPINWDSVTEMTNDNGIPRKHKRVSVLFGSFIHEFAGNYSPVQVDNDGDLTQIGPDGISTKISAQTVGASEGIFEKITATILGTFEKIVAKTVEITSAVINNLTAVFIKTDEIEAGKIGVSGPSVGTATIPVGETVLLVEYPEISPDSKVFLTPEEPLPLGVTIKEGEGFEIKLPGPLETDLKVSYWVID